MFKALVAKELFMVKREDQLLERLLYLSKIANPDERLLL
jgi:hypothetical protein